MSSRLNKIEIQKLVAKEIVKTIPPWAPNRLFDYLLKRIPNDEDTLGEPTEVEVALWNYIVDRMPNIIELQKYVRHLSGCKYQPAAFGSWSGLPQKTHPCTCGLTLLLTGKP